MTPTPDSDLETATESAILNVLSALDLVLRASPELIPTLLSRLQPLLPDLPAATRHGARRLLAEALIEWAQVVKLEAQIAEAASAILGEGA